MSTYKDISPDQKCWSFIKEMNSGSKGSLDRIAMTDGNRDYSYRLMFRLWDYYAEVFSALHITGQEHARAGLTGIPAAESIISFYALNMTGTSVSMVHSVDLKDPDRWERMVREEGITDLLLADSMIDEYFLKQLLKDKERLGLRNIIILHISPSGRYTSQQTQFKSRENYSRLQNCQGALFMEDLLEIYEATPICYGAKEPDEAAVICHTSGTVKGIHKPIPLSDDGLNAIPLHMLEDPGFEKLYGRAVSSLFMDMSSAYAMADMVHLLLAFGGKIVMAPGLPYSRSTVKVLEDNRVNVLFGSGIFMETMMTLPDKPDLSSLEFVFLGGNYVSAGAKKRYDDYLAACRAKTACSIGYGLSETAGACLLASPDRKDASMGCPLPGVKVKIYAEEEERFYDLKDGIRTGVLFLSSPSVSRGRIDKRVYFKLVDIDGEDYLNTYDRVHVAADGSLFYGGRMNKYYVNNQGVRFDAGLVETEISACSGIKSCVIAPGYDKTIHDTIPVLYVSTTGEDKDEAGLLQKILKEVFIEKKLIEKTNLPGQCRICREIPHNEGGKPDITRVRNGQVKGRLYAVMPAREDGALVDVRLKPYRNAPGRRAGIPEELEGMVYRKAESGRSGKSGAGERGGSGVKGEGGGKKGAGSRRGGRGCRIRNGLPCFRNPHHCPYGSQCPKLKGHEDMMESPGLEFK